MRELVCRPYGLGDLERLAPHTGDPAAAVELMCAVSQGARGWTLAEYDRAAQTARGPLACAFVRQADAGHWLLAAATRRDMSLRDWAVASRHVRQKMAMLRKHFAVTAITATVSAREPKALAYLERFGFVLDDGFEPIPGYLTLTRRTA